MTHWIAVLLGAVSVVILVIQTVGDAYELKLWPWWANVILFAAAVHWGQFLAWLDAKRERDELRKHQLALGALEKLASYRQALITLQNENIPDATHLGGWIERYKNLRNEIVEYMKNSISPAESSMFERLGLYAIYNVPKPQALNKDHIDWRSRCIRDWMWLEECAKDYGRRKLRPEEKTPAIVAEVAGDC